MDGVAEVVKVEGGRLRLDQRPDGPRQVRRLIFFLAFFKDFI
jgi:hypothetical protein